MRILFDFKDMIGGAPRSHLAHLLAVKENGHQVIATISDEIDVLKSKIEDVRVIKAEKFSKDKPLMNIRIIFKWLRLLRKEKPDIIYSNRVPQFRFLSVVSDISGIPLVFAQAGGEAIEHTIRLMKGKTPIVYSKENIKTFVKAGFKQNEVHLISNRIPLPQNSIINSDKTKDNILRILIVGNIKKGTISGLMHILDLIEMHSDSYKIPFQIRIAGQDISEGKTYHNTIQDKIKTTNNKITGIGEIKHLGWVENIEDEISTCDIVIGKGRSVLQSAMLGKVCFVISEEGVLTSIQQDSFYSLYEYNFSGRGLQNNNTADFLNLLQERATFGTLQNLASNVVNTIKDAYFEVFAYQKLINSFDIASNTRARFFFVGILRFFRIYLLPLELRIERLFK